MTCWIPNCILRRCGIEERSVTLAWREKFTLCLIILFISLMLFLANIGLFSFLCKNVEEWDPQKISNLHGYNSTNPWTYIRGRIYDLTYIYDANTKNVKSSYIPNHPIQREHYQNVIRTYLGNDLSYIIPPDVSNPEKAAKCKRWPKMTNHRLWCDTKNSVFDGINFCQTSNNTRHYLGVMKTPYYLTYTYDSVKKLNKNKNNHILILRNKIYNMTSYFNQNDQYLGDYESKGLLDRKGYDIAYFVHNLKKSEDFESCLDSQVYLNIYI